MMDLDFKRLSLNLRKSGDLENRMSNRNSISALFSLIAEKDEDVEDKISTLQHKLDKLKEEISVQTKFKIATETAVENLLNKINDSDSTNNNQHLSNFKEQLISQHSVEPSIDEQAKTVYGHLFFELQTDTSHISQLLQLSSYKELDPLIKIVVFSLFGKQYDNREEMLLLQTVQNVLDYDINKSTSFTTLLRGNSVSTKLVTTYTHREAGRVYLDLVLTKTLKTALLQSNNHSKDSLDERMSPVYDQIIDSYDPYFDSHKKSMFRGSDIKLPIDFANSNLNSIAKIDNQDSKTSYITNEILNNIIFNIDKVPYGIRWICKQVMLLSKSKFPDLAEDKLFSIVGGFFFLRYINPAIMLPQLYISIEPELLDDSRNLLKSIAKYIQTLANKPEYSKENQSNTHMKFFNNNIQRVTTFLRDICNVQDFENNLEVEQCLFLTYGPFKINMLYSEIIKIHGLFELNIAENPEKYSQKFKRLFNKLGKCPTNFNNDQKYNFDITMSPYEEVLLNETSNSLKGPLNSSKPDILFFNTKSVFIKIIRSTPSITESVLLIDSSSSKMHKELNNALNLNKIAENASTSSDLKLVRWGIKSKNYLEEMKEFFKIKYDLEYSNLQSELYNEINNLKEFGISLEKDYNNLLEVCDSVVKRNRHLESLLHMYFSFISTKAKPDFTQTKPITTQVLSTAVEPATLSYNLNQMSNTLPMYIRSRNNSVQAENSQNNTKQKSFFPRKMNFFSPLFGSGAAGPSNSYSQTPSPTHLETTKTNNLQLGNKGNYLDKNSSSVPLGRQHSQKSDFLLQSGDDIFNTSLGLFNTDSFSPPEPHPQLSFGSQKANGSEILKKILDLDIIEIAPHSKYACELHQLIKGGVIWPIESKEKEKKKTLVVFTDFGDDKMSLDFFYPVEENEYYSIKVSKEQLISMQESKSSMHTYDDFIVDIDLLLFVLDKVFT
ncbi:hypothetical protein BB561_002199 [Smittium simulii]|uniref:Ras-GAP domain-containing protein n=1 Tax=Smittium simulii TaxID=133385 RepID=A0A2T9YRD6_9FUNG|nr:hypothetical protein BB561_002199 [Smittium simulii]